MATTTNTNHINKLLLLWTMPIPDRVKVLFSMVFITLSDLIKYVSKDIIKTDAFHLIIPLDCFKDLLEDPIYKFPQIVHIYVIYDGISDLKKIRHCLNLKYKKIEFCTIHDLIQRWLKVELDKSDSIDRKRIDAILSLIEDHVQVNKQSNTTSFIKQYTSTSVYGLPVKNINEFISNFICSSCKLFYQEIYKLECEHQLCKICVKIQKSCTICFKEVLCDKVLLIQDSSMKIEDLLICCSICPWTGVLADYKIHFKENHYELITSFIRNKEINENSSYQGTILNNPSSLDSDVLIISLNGTCIWTISHISDMRNNILSDEQKSIYSSAFYSYPNGYKIGLRLFFNGDIKARGTHMSLFFVLMRGIYDNSLHWPFKFKVIFTLLDHILPNHSHSKFFWSDIKSISFQRPRSDMNIVYGISKFFPLDLFKQNENHYIKNDKMFIKVEIDFLSERPAFPLMTDAGELMNEEEFVDANYDNLPYLICNSVTRK